MEHPGMALMQYPSSQSPLSIDTRLATYSIAATDIWGGDVGLFWPLVSQIERGYQQK